MKIKLSVKAERIVPGTDYTGTLVLTSVQTDAARTIEFRIYDPYGENTSMFFQDKNTGEVLLDIKGGITEEKLEALPPLQKALMCISIEPLHQSLGRIETQYTMTQKMKEDYDFAGALAKLGGGQVSLEAKFGGTYTCDPRHEKLLQKFFAKPLTSLVHSA